DAHDLAPLRRSDVHEVVADADAGVVDRDVDAAEQAVELLERGGDPGVIGHVGLEDAGELRVLLRESAVGRRVAIDHGDARALLAEPSADPRADAARPARDEDALSGKPFHQSATPPPSTTSAAPVMNDESSEARKSAAFASSSAVPTRPSGRFAAPFM